MIRMIAFSGGCHSGKTTLMNAVADKLRKQGKTVLVFKENAHYYIKPGGIDALRANPSEYLKFQEHVIDERITFENNWIEGNLLKGDGIVLMDRPITDSLAYMFMYINVNELSDDDKHLYYSLVRKIEEHIQQFVFRTHYDIFGLSPLKQECTQSEIVFRPSAINSVKHVEYSVTKALLAMYPETVNIFNLPDSTTEQQLEHKVKWVLENI